MVEFYGGEAAKRPCRRSTILRLADFFGSDRLRQAAVSDVFWDRITEIRLDGIEETYDLTVDTDHNFVANDLVVHNSHSVAYGLISYQTAYLKANHPLEFMAALLNSRGGDFDKLKQTILDAHAHGLVVHKPDVNRSGAGFTVGEVAIGEILFGLQHVKNVGESVTRALIAARDEGGPFTGLLDLCLRVDSRDLNRRVLESLIQCGALDSLGDRHALLRQLDSAMDHAAAVRRERDLGQTALFGDAVDIIGTLVPHVAPADGDSAPGRSDDSWLAWERDLLGMYLSDHPLRRIATTLQARVDTSINELGGHLDGLIVQVGGCIRDVRAFVPRKSTTGQRMAFLQIEDLTGSCEVVVFNRVFEEVADLLRPDAVVVIRGKVEIQPARTRTGRGRRGARERAVEDPRRRHLRARRPTAGGVAAQQHCAFPALTRPAPPGRPAAAGDRRPPGGRPRGHPRRECGVDRRHRAPRRVLRRPGARVGAHCRGSARSRRVPARDPPRARSRTRGVGRRTARH